MHILALTLTSLIVPVSLVVRAIRVDQAALAMDLSISPLSFVKRAIRPDLPALSMSAFFSYVPLTLVYDATEQSTQPFFIDEVWIGTIVNAATQKRTLTKIYFSDFLIVQEVLAGDFIIEFAAFLNFLSKTVAAKARLYFYYIFQQTRYVWLLARVLV